MGKLCDVNDHSISTQTKDGKVFLTICCPHGTGCIALDEEGVEWLESELSRRKQNATPAPEQPENSGEDDEVLCRVDGLHDVWLETRRDGPNINVVIRDNQMRLKGVSLLPDAAAKLRNALTAFVGDEADAVDSTDNTTPTLLAACEETRQWIIRLVKHFDTLVENGGSEVSMMVDRENARTCLGKATRLQAAIDGATSADPKPTAEVIARQGCTQIVVIDGIGFVTNVSANTCREASRREAQRVMLVWGGDPAEVQSATRAIEA